MPTSPAWELLTGGDKIAFLPSSDPISTAAKEKFSTLLNSYDLTLYESPVELPQYHNDQGTPQQRAAAIIDVLENPEVKALFMRGGSGSDEVIEHLKRYYAKYDLPKKAIPLIGFSDATQFHHYLGSIGAVSPVQGQDPEFLLSDEEYHKTKDKSDPMLPVRRNATEAMFKFLSEGITAEIPLICVNDAARGVEPLDGKTTVFNVHTRRSDYRLLSEESHKPILFIEGGQEGEKVKEGINDAITCLKKTGQLENIQAIVISKSDGRCFVGKELENANLDEIKEAIAEIDVPVFFGAPFGHGSISSSEPLPLGVKTTIKVIDDVVTLKSEGVATAEDIKEITDLCSNRLTYSQHLNDSTPLNEVPKDRRIIPQLIQSSLISGKKIEQENESKDYVACSILRFHRVIDIPAIEREDLSEKDVMIYLSGYPCPSFEDYKKGKPKMNEKRYQDDKFKGFKQSMQMPLMELIKLGNIQNSNSLTFIAKETFPNEVKEWLQEFATGHNLKMPISVANCPDFPESAVSNTQANIIGAVVLSNAPETTVSETKATTIIGTKVKVLSEETGIEGTGSR